MDISTYLEPVNIENLTIPSNTGQYRLADIIVKYTVEYGFPDLDQIDVVLIGVSDDRATINKGSDKAPDEIRNRFYELYSHWNNLRIADIGNIVHGHQIDDTYFAVKEVISELLKSNIVTIIIGGGQDITYANYLAYENIGRIINIASVDSAFDLGHDQHELNNKSYLSHIILHQPNFLFNFTNIGYQTYFVDQDALVLMKNLYFDINRLGNVKAELEEVEPMVRDADILSIDISSIKHGDAPADNNVMPNGFTGEEMCKICRYAGMSDKLSSIGFYELDPSLDNNGQSAHLYAQMMWYFLDGFSTRRNDFPENNNQDYVKFNVQIENFEQELVFLKSKKTDRWWMIVTSKDLVNQKYKRHQFVPCSYYDYQTALNQEIPDRWWKVQQKLM
ncbi:MAG: arginase [Bacteroidetes bacterium]|nr:arginase [Bacteroidota bacterium]|tara:strand:- start:940 stop:2112 length:1173 start_codon:yes stop_codon:yes gene_type:complete